MIIIVVYPSFKIYPERYKEYIKMADFDEVKKVIIYTRELPYGFDKAPKSKKVFVNLIESKFNFYLRTRKKVKKEINKYEEIAVINHFINITPFLRSEKKKVNVVIKFYSPNLLLFFKNFRNSNIKLKPFLLFFKRAMMDIYSIFSSDTIVGNSNNIEITVRRIARIFHLKREIITFPTSVDTDFYCFTKNKNSKDNFRLLFVGNFLKRKGVEDVITVLGKLKNEGIRFRMFFIGGLIDKKLKKRVDERIEKLKLKENIIFLNYMKKNKLRDYYQSSDLMIFSSYYEGSPRVVKEAMACGLPVVAYDIAGIKIIDRGKNIIRKAKIGDINELYQNIKLLMENPDILNDLAKKSRKHMEKYFSISAISKAQFEFFFNILKENENNN